MTAAAPRLRNAVRQQMSRTASRSLSRYGRSEIEGAGLADMHAFSRRLTPILDATPRDRLRAPQSPEHAHAGRDRERLIQCGCPRVARATDAHRREGSERRADGPAREQPCDG